jgi:N-acyl homoserine lactone hydrolase
MKRLFGILVWLAMVSAPASAIPAGPDISMWRLDCGEIHLSNLDEYSDTYQYVGKQKTLTASCYLIRSGERFLLWDTGLPADLKGQSKEDSGMRLSLRSTIRDQLARIGVRPDQISFVGLSHYHFDHSGQAADFPSATLLVGERDWAAVREREARAKPLLHWVKGGGKVETVAGDHDVFGDGRVTMLSMPGHTPGHRSLLVRLPSTGPVLLSGDVYHFEENRANRGVPGFNSDRADSLASMDRFDRIARNVGARVIIQHEPADIAKLPAFPSSAH